MKIACMTTFYDFDRAYSLVSVVEEQLLMLKEGGHQPILFVHDNFNADSEVPEGIEIRKVVPRFTLVDYSQCQPVKSGFDKQVKEIKEALLQNMQDIDAVFTHDWIFQGWFLNYNVGMREAAKELKCKWYHWIHSAPSPRPNKLDYPHNCRYTTMPNSKLIYMNNYDTLRLAEMYGATLDDVRVVYNPLDLRTMHKYSDFTQMLIKRFNLFEADVIQVYPVSSTRFSGKQVDKVIRVLSEIKKQGKSVRFICPNAHANGENEKKAVEDLIHKGIEWGLSRQDMIFTSLEGKRYEMGVPKTVVNELFSLSNLFIFPTLSENCPLILLEAAANKCLLVLNEDFPPLRDFFGENALYFRFSSLIQQTTYPDENKWYSDVAKIILGEMAKNKVLNSFTKLRQKFNREWIMKNQLTPILYENGKLSGK